VSQSFIKTPDNGPHSALAGLGVLQSEQPARDTWRGGSSYEASMLRNLLARIHRDGGHYIEQHGLDKALEDAEAKVVQWLTRDDSDAHSDALYANGGAVDPETFPPSDADASRP
jgi:hypothetical protein